MSSDPTRRDDGGKHEGEAHSSPYPVSRLAPAFDLVDVAKQIADADTMLGATAHARLAVIAEQIRTLQEAARRVLEETRADLELHRARCSFVKRAGHTYHLYRRSEGETYFSLIGPEEWKTPDAKREFLGSYRLEVDQSWTKIEGDEPAAPAVAALIARLTSE